jgi:hypothetical protein
VLKPLKGAKCLHPFHLNFSWLKALILQPNNNKPKGKKLILKIQLLREFFKQIKIEKGKESGG